MLRPFNAYGPRCHHEGDSGEVIPKFMLRCLAGSEPPASDQTYGEPLANGGYRWVRWARSGSLFTGGFGGVVRIPGTTSFLLNAGVETGSSSTEKPTIFRFDL